jgi:hypothetical protein
MALDTTLNEMCLLVVIGLREELGQI